MFDVGGGELLLIVVAILVLFGPKKIPEVASMIGKGMRKVRQAQDEFTQHMRDLSTDLEHVGPRSSPIAGSLQPNLSPVESLPEAFVVASSETGYSMNSELKGDETSDSISTTDLPELSPSHDNAQESIRFQDVQTSPEDTKSLSENSSDSEALSRTQPPAPAIRIQPPSGSITR